MKLRIIIALILTLLLLSVARRLSERKPELEIIANEGIRIEHTTVVEKIGDGDIEIITKVETPKSVQEYKVNLYYRIDQEVFLKVPMLPKKDEANSFFASIPSQPKGKRAYYYLAVTDRQGNEVTLPDRVNRLKQPFMIKFKGKVAPFVLITHIITMFAGVFFVSLALFFDIDLLRGKDALRDVANVSILAVLFIFLGGFILGPLVAYQTFGVAYEGFPFGWDITDNKTLIIFLYWLILLYLMKGTLLKKNHKLNVLGNRSISILVLMGVILTILIYLIPHSI